jgi:hypothetical protein
VGYRGASNNLNNRFTMKHLDAILLLCLLSSCVHVEKTPSTPVSGVLNDSQGHPIRGAQVWAYCTLPGGFFAAKKHVSWGPGITNSEGKFSIPMTPVSMVQTGTIFDGSTMPMIMVVDRERGCFGQKLYEDDTDLSNVRITFPRLDPQLSFDEIKDLDAEDWEIARRFLRQR